MSGAPFMHKSILRALPTGSLSQWERDKPRMHVALEHMERVIGCAPVEWQVAVRSSMQVDGQLYIEGSANAAPEWVEAWDLMQAVAYFSDRFGDAAEWNWDDHKICKMAKRLADEAGIVDAWCLSRGDNLARRVDATRMLVRCAGVAEDKPIVGLPAIKRAQDPSWWRRRLRRHVGRVIEGGNIRFGRVHGGADKYVSESGLRRHQEQLKRNAEALERSLYKNEAGQVYNLAELAALGVSNPLIRGGELMTRIRGAEEYADSRQHVGLFFTLTSPSRFHAVRYVKGKTAKKEKYAINRKYSKPEKTEGEADQKASAVEQLTPKLTQQWHGKNWQKARAKLARKGVRPYGLRVAEPHHDGTTHWHALFWVENEEQAQLLESVIRDYWLRDAGNERGAQENRVDCKRMLKGGATGYVAKYITKSVGHVALAEHQDVVNGNQINMEFGGDEKDVQQSAKGFQRVAAWASIWGIRQFQTIGLPSVTVWRELRRVSKDQLELFAREGDKATVRAFGACHRQGDLRADFRQFMEAMGGHALRRDRWHLRTVTRMVEPGQVNKYDEEVKVGRIVGLTPQQGRMSGRWLVSRRIFWTPVASAVGAKDDAAQIGDAADLAQGTGTATSRQALPAARTGFNNCTARITHGLRQALFGISEREKSPTYPPETIEYFRRLRQQEAMQ